MKPLAATARLRHACERRVARHFGCRRFVMPAGTPIASFTFDDFPRSALLAGGPILESVGVAGTYYASFGQSGQITATGEQFHADDIAPLLHAGHELGCHTFEHRHAWQTSSADFEASVQRNAEALRAVAPWADFRTHSYPMSYPRPATKRRLSRHFAACRGGGQTFNAGPIDLNCLNAFFIEQSGGSLDAIRRIIEANVRAGGWLIFATHDIAPTPTRFGCTPVFLEQIVHACIVAGTAILPMCAALRAIGVAVEPVVAATA